jgi:hypothetical protein
MIKSLFDANDMRNSVFHWMLEVELFFLCQEHVWN